MKNRDHLIYYAVILCILSTLSIISLLLLAITPFVVHALTIFFPTTQSAGQFGDQFGALNALFSGLGLCLVAATLFLQTHELRLQRDENQETQQILSRQDLQLQIQSEAALRQAFEDTFFSLLDVLKSSRIGDEAIRSILDAHVGNPYEAIWNPKSRKTISDDLKRSINSVYEDFVLSNEATRKIPIEQIDSRLRMGSVFAASWPSIREDLRYYIRNLEIVLLHIGKAHTGSRMPDFDGASASRWADVVKSTMSRRELTLVALASEMTQFKDLCFYTRLYGFFEDYKPYIQIDEHIASYNFKIGNPVESLELSLVEHE